MGLLATILDKLGIGKKPEAAPQAPAKPAAAPAPKPAGPAPASTVSSPKIAPAPPATSIATPPKPAPMAMVDVVSKLDKMAAGKDLNWKVSIVDLLKVLGMDSSLKARKELAVELGCPKELMGGDSAKMNTWLHKEVLRRISQNGGNIPKELLD